MKNIHVLSTSQPSRLIYNSTTNKLDLYKMTAYSSQSKRIYITSDEEIKEGDWAYNPVFYEIEGPWFYNPKFNGIGINHNPDGCKKIILTTDQDLIKDGVQAIDDEFLEWFVKNPTYEEIYIIKQYKQVNQDNPITKGSTALMFSHYEIHLLKATQQMIDEWNLIYCKLNNRQIPTKEESKQERSYSEEEVIELLQKALTHQDDGETGSLVTAQGKIRTANFYSWFNKFKNK